MNYDVPSRQHLVSIVVDVDLHPHGRTEATRRGKSVSACVRDPLAGAVVDGEPYGG